MKESDPSVYIDSFESVNFRVDEDRMMTDPFYQLAVIDFMYLDSELDRDSLPVS